jgi:hypothetical protein
VSQLATTAASWLRHVEAGTRMSEEQTGCLVVFDIAGRPCAVVTDRDLACRAVARAAPGSDARERSDERSGRGRAGRRTDRVIGRADARSARAADPHR